MNTPLGVDRFPKATLKSNVGNIDAFLGRKPFIGLMTSEPSPLRCIRPCRTAGNRWCQRLPSWGSVTSRAT